MSEGLAKRMRSIVGDENTVARYLLEKVGHTGAIAWLAGCIVLGLVLARVAPSLVMRAFLAAAAIALASAVGYDLLGKALWLTGAARRGWVKDDGVTPVKLGEEVVDTLFDAWVGCSMVASSTGVLRWWLPVPALALWVVGVAIGSNNQWGKPS